MRYVVINGTEIKGCTYHLKEFFLDELKAQEVQEFYLPKDAPDYCTGCKRCFVEGEEKCPHFHKVNPVWQAMKAADIIVFAYPVYVLRTPGQVKALLDHFGCHWFVHRPEPVLLDKIGVILTQSVGAPNGAAQKDVKTSMEWLGISKIKTKGFGMMEGVIWDEISLERRKKMESKVRAFAREVSRISPRKWNIKTKLYFLVSKQLKKGTYKKLSSQEKPSVELQYWIDRGWLKQGKR